MISTEAGFVETFGSERGGATWRGQLRGHCNSSVGNRDGKTKQRCFASLRQANAQKHREVHEIVFSALVRLPFTQQTEHHRGSFERGCFASVDTQGLSRMPLSVRGDGVSKRCITRGRFISQRWLFKTVLFTSVGEYFSTALVIVRVTWTCSCQIYWIVSAEPLVKSND